MVERDVTIYSGFDSFIIDSIFKDNYTFYSLFYDENIKWKLYEDKDVSIVATVTSRKEYLLSININAIMDASAYGDYKSIEYYILHEIRHIYQNEQIRRYKAKEAIEEPESIIKEWIKEKKLNLKRKNEDGGDNVDFYMLKKEYDAYAFAYAVMKYRYENEFDPFIPEPYKRPFLIQVKRWMDLFKREGI